MLEIIPTQSLVRSPTQEVQNFTFLRLPHEVQETTGPKPMITRLQPSEFATLQKLPDESLFIVFNLNRNGTLPELESLKLDHHLAMNILLPGKTDTEGRTIIYPWLDVSNPILMKQLLLSDEQKLEVNISVKDVLTVVDDLLHLNISPNYLSKKILDILNDKYSILPPDSKFYFRIYKKIRAMALGEDLSLEI